MNRLGLRRLAGRCVRFLPPYSPDFNPMEKLWSKVQGARRSAKSGTAKALNRAIAAALAAVTSEDGGGRFAAHLIREKYQELRPQAGERVFVELKRVKVFSDDYSI